MEDIYTLARQPNGDALKISNFSWSFHPGKNEATFTHWMYEVKDALNKRASWTAQLEVEFPARGRGSGHFRTFIRKCPKPKYYCFHTGSLCK